ncbi:MAG: hypothetical protein B6I36_06375 [Desulfobacteraceae bacterium 4572_35.1]|nr:MAG: hypothetical protein B6I36_06375 [Desulfobacteraceae bacterium 4572_35.1]
MLYFNRPSLSAFARASFFLENHQRLTKHKFLTKLEKVCYSSEYFIMLVIYKILNKMELL